MSKTLLNSFLIVLLMLPASLFGQLKYEIHGQFGISNLLEKNQESGTIVTNYYSNLPSYSLGIGIGLPTIESNFFPMSGFYIISLAAKNNMSGDPIPNYTGPTSWEERFYSINIPVKVSYRFEKWIYLNAGVSNIIHLNKPDKMWDKKINHYTIGFTGGLDFLIKNRFIIGCNYYRDLIQTAKLLQWPSRTDTYKISYSFEQISFKIGYIINKAE